MLLDRYSPSLLLSLPQHGPDALQEEDRVSGGLVDVDSVDELCEELLHLHGTQIQCGTSDMERKQDLDVMADGGEHENQPSKFRPSHGLRDTLNCLRFTRGGHWRRGVT